MAGAKQRLDHDVRVTHPEKVLFPRDGLTKQQLIDYYLSVADLLLPHIKGRPLTMRPYPGGIDGEAYYRRNTPKGAPDWLRGYRYNPNSKPGATTTSPIVDDEASLTWLVNFNAIEIHPWTSRVDPSTDPTSWSSTWTRPRTAALTTSVTPRSSSARSCRS